MMVDSGVLVCIEALKGAWAETWARVFGVQGLCRLSVSHGILLSALARGSM